VWLFIVDENARRTKVEKRLRKLVHPEVLCTTEITDGGQVFKPDGFMKCECPRLPDNPTAAPGITEIKNGIGEAHSDPIHQAQCDYVTYYSAIPVHSLFISLTLIRN
jgi:hypothetical protein